MSPGLKSSMYGVLVLAATMARSAAAAPPEASAPKAPPPAAGGPVDVRATVIEHGPNLPFELLLENGSQESVKVVADPRLLSFEATVPDQKKTIKCNLPSGMAPKYGVPDAVVELRPGEHVTRTFDPRFFCFDKSARKALVPGAQLTPTYGWEDKKKTKWRKGKKVVESLPAEAPFIAEPTTPGSSLAPVKNVELLSIMLGPEYSAWVDPEEAKKDKKDKKKGKAKKDEPLPEPPSNEPPKTDPELRITASIDARDERSVVATVELRNPTKQKLTMFFRRENVTFEVLGPEGLVQCIVGPDQRAPERTAFSTLQPGGSTRLTSRVVELCPRGTFGRPGLYLLSAVFESVVDGAEFGMQTYLGSVRTEKPVTVRVREGDLPFLVVPLPPKPEEDKTKSAAGAKTPSGTSKDSKTTTATSSSKTTGGTSAAPIAPAVTTSPTTKTTTSASATSGGVKGSASGSATMSFGTKPATASPTRSPSTR